MGGYDRGGEGRGRFKTTAGDAPFFLFLSSSSLDDAGADVHRRIVVVPSFLFVIATTSMAVGGRGEGGWMSSTSLS